MNDDTLLSMLQQRMAEAAARRAPFLREEAALCRRLAETRENLRRCLGTVPGRIVAPQVRVEAQLELGDTNVIQITHAFADRVIAWFDRNLEDTP
jgi:hypothetical protein